MKPTVVVGVSGGIAAFKVLTLIKLLEKQQINIKVIMTRGATCIVGPKEFEKTSGHKVLVDLFEKDFDYRQILKARRVEHVDIAQSSQLIVVAPATANIIAKLAHGIADDYLTTTILAAICPIIICPSMNVHMWENPLVQENVAKLKKLGYRIIEPEEGTLACGYEGKGRLAHIQKIKEKVIHTLQTKNRLHGKKIIVTTGATIEKMDDVRFISNKSSGKMGVAIAEECYLQGANVLLLRSATSIEHHFPIAEKLFETSDQLAQFIKTCIPSCDVIFHTAAV